MLRYMLLTLLFGFMLNGLKDLAFYVFDTLSDRAIVAAFFRLSWGYLKRGFPSHILLSLMGLLALWCFLGKDKIVSPNHNQDLSAKRVRAGTRGGGRVIHYDDPVDETSLTAHAISMLKGNRRTGIFLRDVRAKLLGILTRDGCVGINGELIPAADIPQKWFPRMVSRAIRRARESPELQEFSANRAEDWVQLWIEDYEGQDIGVGENTIWWWRLEHRFRLFCGLNLHYPSQ